MEDIEELIDKTLTGIRNRNNEIVFELLGDQSLRRNQSRQFSLIAGSVNNVIGAPILDARETTELEGSVKIYTLSTIKGSAVIRSRA